MVNPAHASTVALPPALTSSPDLGGLAALGKVVFALLLIIAVILVCTWLLRRFGPTRGVGAKNLRIVATRAVGTKERVVVLEVEGTWLVLGVTSTQISKLHELPAVETPPTASVPVDESFAKRLSAAFKHNLRGGKS